MEHKTEQQLIAEAYVKDPGISDEDNRWLARHYGKLSKEAKAHPTAKPNATEKQIDAGLNSENELIRKQSIEHPNVSAANLHTALNNKDHSASEELFGNKTALAALKHKNFTAEHVSAAMKHPKAYIRNAALEHPALTKAHLNTYLKNPQSSMMLARKAAKKRGWEIKTKTVHSVE